MKRVIIGLWCLAAVMGIGAAWSAERIRCGNDLIGPGDSAVAFFASCGMPAGRSTYVDEEGEIVQRYFIGPSRSGRGYQVEVVRGEVRVVESVRR